ncbi:unnamed protein product [Lymnaea stagnalis]|uniref:Vitamin K-dependent gamma-carboxylase n=1 Tax=Lymnaea stagnalis TaxID=6523 RepID=A0AAV2HBU5_LYMST
MMVRKRALSSVGHSNNATGHAPKNDTSKSKCPEALTDNITMQQLFGFEKQDLTSWANLVRLLCRPADPACLGTLRVLFGFLMILDTIEERGMAMADVFWGMDDDDVCRFPLFNFLHPLPLVWMYLIILHSILSAALGIMFGFKFRMSCTIYVGCYWYLFFLDKATWNNHSYLFGILAFLFAISDANRYWSLDGFFNPKINNAHIPLWNYTLMRAQVFLVYFIAGLKKLDLDWMSGYSMHSLSEHRVFSPFKIFLTPVQIDLYIVHFGGLTIDLFIGFILFFDKTRRLGLTIATTFHLMNSQLFSIGMFPYTMIATGMLFCSSSWPREFFKSVPDQLKRFTPEVKELLPSCHCIYTKNNVKLEVVENPTIKNKSSLHKNANPESLPTAPSSNHSFWSAFTLIFILWQSFLPYSHGITKGYNNWTNGLYGYSWDMMVHHWSVQHVRIKYFDKDKGESGYLDPNVWSAGNRRWSSHADMMKQYAECIAGHLKTYNITHVEIYFDIWQSLNDRFQQRMVNPHVDLVAAEWSPFKSPSFIMPLMVDLSDWRTKLEQIEASLDDELTNFVFVADFPGLYLESYVQPDFKNTTLSVLDGKVIVELLDQKRNITLNANESLQIPAGTFHNIYTVSETPSCYMYLFVNTTEAELNRKYQKFEQEIEQGASVNETLQKYSKDPDLHYYQKRLTFKQNHNETVTNFMEKIKAFLKKKYSLIRRSLQHSFAAVYCITTNSSFSEYLNASYQLEQKL